MKNKNNQIQTKMKNKFILLFVMFILVAPLVFAEDVLVHNSQNYQEYIFGNEIHRIYDDGRHTSRPRVYPDAPFQNSYVPTDRIKGEGLLLPPSVTDENGGTWTHQGNGRYRYSLSSEDAVLEGLLTNEGLVVTKTTGAYTNYKGQTFSLQPDAYNVGDWIYQEETGHPETIEVTGDGIAKGVDSERIFVLVDGKWVSTEYRVGEYVSGDAEKPLSQPIKINEDGTATGVWESTIKYKLVGGEWVVVKGGGQPSEDKIYNILGDNNWEYNLINNVWYTRKKNTDGDWLSLENNEEANKVLDEEFPDARPDTETVEEGGHPGLWGAIGNIIQKLSAPQGEIDIDGDGNLDTWSTDDKGTRTYVFGNGDEMIVYEDDSREEIIDGKGTKYDKDGNIIAKSSDGGATWKELKDMKWFGLKLDEWTYITSGYRGFSLFYDEPSWWLFYDETVMNVLGGIDGWTSEICKAKISDAHDSGIAMSSTTSGAFAHIEGEKIKVIDYSGETPETQFLYKISLEVDPGPEFGGCDMKFKVYIQKPRRSVFKNSKTGLAYTFKVEKGNESVSYKGQDMIFKQSKTNYEEVCIYFSELKGGCLAGIKEGEDLCNKLVDGGEKKIDLGEDPCDIYPLMINCWFRGEEEPYTETSEREEGEADWGDW